MKRIATSIILSLLPLCGNAQELPTWSGGGGGGPALTGFEKTQIDTAYNIWDFECLVKDENKSKKQTCNSYKVKLAQANANTRPYNMCFKHVTDFVYPKKYSPHQKYTLILETKRHGSNWRPDNSAPSALILGFTTPSKETSFPSFFFLPNDHGTTKNSNLTYYETIEILLYNCETS